MKTLQQIRKESGLTQEEISKLLDISQQTYARYEKEDAQIPSSIIKKLESILMADLSFINNDVDNENCITDFLNSSLTSYHAVKNTKDILLNNGFVELFENKPWKLEKDGKYFVTKNQSCIVAFKIGDLSSYSFNIASCHTDSPCLKVKGNSLLNSPEGKRINVERYGGLINYSIMDIPLKVAGRVVVQTEEGLEERIIESSYNVNIPSLCIHHNRGVNENLTLNPQVDLLPLFGDYDDLYKSLLPNEIIVDSDLYCVPFVKPTYSGVNDENLVSPRIDNLTSLYSILKAIISSKSKGISILYATDNEEIGSLSKQGAESSFINEILLRITLSLGKTKDDYYAAKSNGFILSIDNGHAIHPNHPEKSDPDQIVTLNNGVVIKHHPHYSTDAVSSSVIKEIARKNKVKVQDYYNRSDIPCGSTIGLVTSAQLGMNAADIGLAQLAMHSCIETVGKYDILEMTKLVKGFYETSLEVNDSKIKIN